jgi:hypothetical protein
MTLIFSSVYTVSMPRWYIPCMISTLTYAISRSLIFEYAEGKVTMEKISPMETAFGFILGSIYFSITYFFRLHLIRGFVY